MIRKLFTGLRMGLFLIVLVIVLPIMGLFIASSIEQYHLARENLANETEQLTRITVNQQKQLLENARGILITISEQFLNDEHTPSECQHLLNDLLQRFPQFADLAIVNPAGELFCSARTDLEQMNFAGQSWFQQAAHSQDFIVGNYKQESSTGRSMLAVAYPVLIPQKKAQFYTVGLLDLDWINQLATQANLPEKTTITLIDNQGIIFARFPDPQKFVGKFYHQAGLLKLANEKHQGNVEATGVDGLQRFYNFELLPYSQSAFIFVGIPIAGAMQPITNRLVRDLVILLIISVLGLKIAVDAGNRFFIRRIENVAAAAQKLAEGDLSSCVELPSNSSDIYNLAYSFNYMAKQLQDQQEKNEATLSALQLSEERFRRLTENAQDIIFRYELLPEPHFSFINQACLAITGCTPQEHYDNPHLSFKFIHPDDHQLLESLLNPTTPVSDSPLILRWQHKNGQVIWTEQSTVFLYNVRGEIIAVEGIARDITKRVQMEEALNIKIEELQRFQQLTVGRELRMIELKKEINALRKRVGEPEKYQGYSHEPNDGT